MARALAVICGKTIGFSIYGGSSQSRSDLEAVVGTSNVLASLDRCIGVRDEQSEEAANNEFKKAIGILLGFNHEIVVRQLTRSGRPRIPVVKALEEWFG
jgi:hypothetical protein